MTTMPFTSPGLPTVGAAVQTAAAGVSSASPSRVRQRGERVRTVVGIGVLGSLRVVCDGRDVTPTPPKLRQFLALLVAHAGEVVRLETIVEEMWGTEPTVRHCRTVQTYISQLRKLLAASPVTGAYVAPVTISHTSRIGYSLRLGPGGRTDLSDFRRLSERVLADDLGEADSWLAATDRLFRGAPLSDIVLGAVLTRHQDRIENERAALIERHADRRLGEGRADLVADLAARTREIDIRHESLHVKVIRAAQATGRHDEAVGYLQAVCDGSRNRSSVLGPDLRDLVEQLTGSDAVRGRIAPTVADAAQPSTVPAQLPVDLLPFVGFEAEMRRALDALRIPREDGDRPGVVAIIGGPGTGKTAFGTRLAEQAASDFPDGQLYVDLRHTSLYDALGGFLRALGVESVPESRTERVRSFRHATRSRRILTFVDGVTGPEALSMLMPGGHTGGIVLASSVRPAADPRSCVIELGRFSDAERWELFERRLGPERVAAEPDQAARALASTDGLPVAVNILAAKALMRPHWSLRKLADGAGRWECPTTSWKIGALDLGASVRRSLALLEPDVQPLARTLMAAPVSARCTVREAAALLDSSDEVAEGICEALVELRMADAVKFPPEEQERLSYRIPALYRIAIRTTLLAEAAARNSGATRPGRA